MGYKLRVGIIRVLSGRWFRGGGCGPWVTRRLPTAKCLASTARHHVLDSKINNRIYYRTEDVERLIENDV